jgi:hypothetical protein
MLSVTKIVAYVVDFDFMNPVVFIKRSYNLVQCDILQYLRQSMN